MIINKNIPIKNIYYMLTYAFKELRHNNYEYIEGEHFDNIYDLFAEILSKGISYLLKQGLHKQYILREVQKVYRSQGVDINDKHVELIARRMISQIRIMDSGDTKFLPSTVVSINKFTEGNKDVILQEPGFEGR